MFGKGRLSKCKSCKKWQGHGLDSADHCKKCKRRVNLIPGPKGRSDLASKGECVDVVFSDAESSSKCLPDTAVIVEDDKECTSELCVEIVSLSGEDESISSGGSPILVEGDNNDSRVDRPFDNVLRQRLLKKSFDDSLRMCRFCFNCKREELELCVVEDESDFVRPQLRTVPIENVIWKYRKWRTFGKVDVEKLNDILLCLECIAVISKNASDIPWHVCWPVVFWRFLSSSIYYTCYSKRRAHAVPHQWIKYWLSNLCVLPEWGYEILAFVSPAARSYFTSRWCSVSNVSPRIYEDICTTELKPVCIDVTVRKERMERVLRELRLGEMKKLLNKELIPCVLCPWGCSEYLHKTGAFCYRSILVRYFPSCGDRLCSKLNGKLQRCLSARSDYFSPIIDMHLCNPEWSVHPSVCFVAGKGPVFLTCLEHDRGTPLQYFHLPKTPSCLASLQPDFLSHAVLRSRTLKPSKAHKYSNSYQLTKCTANYCGIDTCYVGDDRNFCFQSHLNDVSEAISYAGREDIRGLVGRLVREKKMPSDLASSVEERAQELYSNNEILKELTEGGTMMVLLDCMRLQKMLYEPQIVYISVSRKTEKVGVRKTWNTSLIYVHSLDKFGAAIPHTSAMKPKKKSKEVYDIRYLWVLCNMLLSVPRLWEVVGEDVYCDKQWNGHVLTFLSCNILAQKQKGISSHPYLNYFCTPYVLSQICLDDVSAIQETKDGYKPEHVMAFFHRLVGKGVVITLGWKNPLCCSALASSAGVSIKGKAQDCEFIFVYADMKADSKRCLGRCPCRPPSSFDVECDKYELRFVCATEHKGYGRKKDRPGGKKQKVSQVDNWSGVVYRRHGGSIFSGWWKSERSSAGRQAMRVDELDEVWKTFGVFDILVYVKCKVVNLEEYRRDYLKYIGGQNRAVCGMHDVPLITSKSRAQMACCGKPFCHKESRFNCPAVNCVVAICYSCFKDLPDEDCTKLEPGHHDRGKVNAENICDNEDAEECSEVSQLEGNDMFCLEEEVLSDCEASIDVAVGDLHTGANDILEDLENAPNVEEWREGGLKLATTNEYSEPQEAFGRFGYMGSSVLLNKCGTMLVRRQTQLQAGRRERNMLERVVSNRDIGTVPLVYLEGILFPSIFWNLPHSSDGGVVGSIPTALFCQHETRKKHKVASIAEHAKVRLKSVGSTACGDPRYLSFLFDALANGAIEGHDTRVVLSRGFEACMGQAGMRMRNGDDDLYTDTIDNRQNVHNLCASEREEPSTLFLTLTCNQKQHFGIKMVKEYIDSDQCVNNYLELYSKKFPREKELSENFKVELKKAFEEAARNLIVRNWMEIRVLLIKYISESEERPAGEVLKIFVRDEYQPDVGNLSHLHMLITLRQKYEDEKGREWIESIIRGTIDDIVGLDEVEGYIEEGLLDSWEDYQSMKDDASRFLKHTCSARCMRRTGVGKDDLVCRVPDPRQMSQDLSNFYEYGFDVVHSEEAILVLERLGFVKPRKETGGCFVPLHDFLKPKRILPPVRLGEGNISPVIGRLFAATRSQMNVQICTTFGTSRYIVKYIIKIDEGNYVVFGCDPSSEGKITAQRVMLHNTKITSSAGNETAKLKKSRHQNKTKGRQIAATEKMQIVWGFPQVHSNIEFVRVATLPFGERCGLERIPPSASLKHKHEEARDVFDLLVPSVVERKKLFGSRASYRCHTLSQEAMLKDQMESSVTLDRVFLFGIRPPELLAIDKLEWYYRYFERSESPIITKEHGYQEILNRNLWCSPWVDGLGYCVRVRSLALEELKAIVRSLEFKDESRRKACLAVQKLLDHICEYYSVAGMNRLGSAPLGSSCLRFAQQKQWKNLQKIFVSHSVSIKRLPIPVFSNVVPKNSVRFITHIVLSMGHFETENDLWTSSDMVQVFKHAKLLPNTSNCVTEEHVDAILKKWVTDQLRFYPIGSRRMDEYMVAASEVLRSVILHNELPMNEMPPYLHTSLVKDTQDSIKKYILEAKRVLIQTTVSAVQNVYGAESKVIPSVDGLLHATKSAPIEWKESFPITKRQSKASFAEQKVIQELCMRTIDRYCACGVHITKNVAIAGPPGAGKTHCLSHAIVYALCKGLSVMTTALLADRAFVLGGKHIHSLFKLVVRDSGSPYRLAELAVINLQKKPEALELLRRLDVLVVDEMSQMSAQLLSTLDIVLRRIRDSSLFMGGLLVIGSIDQVQLRPVRGLPFLLSPFVLTTFAIGILEEYVRCSTCERLQEMNAIARFNTRDRDAWKKKLLRFEYILRNSCTFVSTWDSPLITKDVVTIFPRKYQTDAATKRFINKKKNELQQSGGAFLTSTADDQMLSLESHGEWKCASKEVSRYLDGKCKEPQCLDLFVGCFYTFTFNSPGCFNHTQIGVLLELPSRETILQFAPFKIWVAPPGKQIGFLAALCRDKLKEEGWTEVLVGTVPEYQHTMWDVRVKARRKQYGIKIRVSSTIHASIGASLGKIATELTIESNLWERAMVVVLISRVTRASDLIFVGDKEGNIQSLLRGLSNRDQYDEYMNHIVDVIVNSKKMENPRPVQQSLHPFRPKDIPLPGGNTYVVYILVSAKDIRSTYVGYSQNVALRLRQHNSGIGSKESADAGKRPWALYGYVTGFMYNKKLAMAFESQWQRNIYFVKPRHVSDAAGLASGIIASDDFVQESLVLVLCSR